MTIDPITLSVIQAGLAQVCDEMDLTFSRAAFSPVIAEANDRSDGIYDATDGALIAQGGLYAGFWSRQSGGFLNAASK
jgi:N-methylhydantoinase B